MRDVRGALSDLLQRVCQQQGGRARFVQQYRSFDPDVEATARNLLPENVRWSFDAAPTLKAGPMAGIRAGACKLSAAASLDADIGAAARADGGAGVLTDAVPATPLEAFQVGASCIKHQRRRGIADGPRCGGVFPAAAALDCRRRQLPLSRRGHTDGRGGGFSCGSAALLMHSREKRGVLEHPACIFCIRNNTALHALRSSCTAPCFSQCRCHVVKAQAEIKQGIDLCFSTKKYKYHAC